MIVTLRANVHSEIFATLEKMASIPTKKFMQLAASKTAILVRAGLHQRQGTIEARSQTGDPRYMYTAIKRVIAGTEAIAGRFSGATEKGITSDVVKAEGDEWSGFGETNELIGMVYLRGMWPDLGDTTFYAHVPYTIISALSDPDSFTNIDSIDQKIKDNIGPELKGKHKGGFTPHDLVHGGPGATIKLARSQGFAITWDKEMEHIASGLRDLAVPAQEMMNKRYGEFGGVRPFMYVSNRQAKTILDYSESMVSQYIFGPGAVDASVKVEHAQRTAEAKPVIEKQEQVSTGALPPGMADQTQSSLFNAMPEPGALSTTGAYTTHDTRSESAQFGGLKLTANRLEKWLSAYMKPSLEALEKRLGVYKLTPQTENQEDTFKSEYESIRRDAERAFQKFLRERHRWR